MRRRTGAPFEREGARDERFRGGGGILSAKGIERNAGSRVLVALGGVLAVLLFGSLGFAAAGEGDGDRVPLERVPARVKAVLQREAAGATIQAVEREEEDGEIHYKASVTLDGRNYEIEVTEEGVLVEKELEAGEEEEEVSLAALPPAVRATITREASGGTIQEIEKKTHAAWTTYEVDLELDGRAYEMLVAPGGTLIRKALERGEKGEEEEEAGEGREADGSVIWGFDRDEAGGLPAGWSADETAGMGNPAVWQVVADPSAPSAPHVVAITKNENYGHTFNLLVARNTRFRDLALRLRVKAIAGEEDQGGGPIWRARDGDNDSICRWNPLEQNFRVYTVKQGRRRQLASARVDADPSTWHTIGILHEGTHIEARFDEKKLLEVRDDTFPDAGMVGLWVKADGRTAFDDLRVTARDEGDGAHHAGRVQSG